MKIAVLFAVVCALHAQTFTRDVAPILYKNCVQCHRPGEAAPFSLIEYKQVRAHASQIASVTKARYMPPWKPSAGCGSFEHESRLSEGQIRILAAWATAGAPEGNPAELPKLPDFTEGWQLGAPDLIVTLEKPYTLAASGPEVFRNFVLSIPVDRTRYVRAIEIRPGQKKVVHHANILIDREGNSRSKEGKDGAPGFAGMDPRVETRSFDPESHFLFWKPGTVVTEEPEGMAWQVGPGTDLILNMHLQPSGKPEVVQPSIGLYFTDKRPSKLPMLIQLERDGALDIPAGQREYVVTDELKLPVDVTLLGVYPHAHYVAKDIRAEAVLPNGSRSCLIHIADWDIAWQAVYRYSRPMALPAGTVVRMRYTYDNSGANPRNPSAPPRRVQSGDRSTDEMAHLWLQVLPAKGDSRLDIQKAVMQRRLAKYPGDFLAEFTLGSIAQSQGETDKATGHYRNALKARPDDAAAHNGLGAALLESGKTNEAVREFRAALSADHDYADAHYNLARILLSADQVPLAIQHLREVVRLQPSDAQAMSDLGAALHMSGQAENGLVFLHRAVEIEPDSFNARFNLGQALAVMGKKAEAEIQFKEALRIKPGDADTETALRQLSRQ